LYNSDKEIIIIFGYGLFGEFLFGGYIEGDAIAYWEETQVAKEIGEDKD
jgi:hypothetical protein